jgi:tetratricopeptide (TPR) repeat protein
LPFRDGSAPQAVTDCRRLSQQGVAALERGQQQNAETLLAKAVAACPADAEAHRHYAEALWRRGARKEAIAQLQQSSRLLGDDASVSVRLAEMQLADGQLEPARQNAEQTLRLDPKLPGAWAVRGGVMRAAGQSQEALADQLRALGYAPNDRTILMEIAELHRELNQPDRALHTLQTLADTYSSGEEPGQVLYLMGLAYNAMGRPEESLASLKAAVGRGKPTPEMFHGLAEAEFMAGHPVQAAEAARQALALQPQHQPSRELLDRIELAQRSQGTVR